MEFGFGFGRGSGYSEFSMGGSVKYKGWGLGMYSTQYTGVHAQRVGGVQAFAPGGSLRIENDFWPVLGDKYDRLRTSAAELEIGGLLIGKSVYTNSPDRNADRDESYFSRFYRKFGLLARPEAGTYADGRVYSSPAWVGVRHGKHFVSRAGINHPAVQDIFQNGVHLIKSGSPLFITPYGVYNEPWGFSGYYNPYSLY
ncbi:polymorphic toxin type 23 domain-containing protein [Alkalitalea saponilacus]|uniref:Toxin 23 n=1 Tax=Alkalitalea saponilacus TaxID=889453 RepID=A0A1T5A6S4_9BACT|nr:polymorphic toxin type 23 domain-containing protein [Alkalitalea saponilacus]ASB48828.1 hypothetical protein CDL62_06630 [Alkalitalea saponilacus]SKB30630.1 toxin 23 [Alkalitalea saponilacus]